MVSPKNFYTDYVLSYPTRNGKTLRLRFSNFKHVPDFWQAVMHCQKLKLRLPTAREIFDYCAAGVTEPNYGPNYIHNKYPKDGRCGSGNDRSQRQMFSASIVADKPASSWVFNSSGDLSSNYRMDVSPYGGTAVCVGKEGPSSPL